MPYTLTSDATRPAGKSRDLRARERKPRPPAEDFEALIAPDFREAWPDHAAVAERDRLVRGRLVRRRHWASFRPDNPAFAYHGPIFDPTRMVDSIVERMTDAGAVGFTWAIARYGRLVDAGGVGDARTAAETDPREMDADVRMVSASLAKPVCALAVMNLVESGVLTLDEPAYPYMQAALPDADPSFETVTIRTLLTHTAGYTGSNLHSAFVGGGYAQPLPPPLANSSYHNHHYWALAFVVEGATGQDYVDYATDTILSPMGISGMNREVDDVAPCLYYDSGSVTNGQTWDDTSVTQIGAYGWFASAIDWARLLVGFRYDLVTTQATRLGMLSAPETYFGFRKWNGQPRGTYYGHGADFGMTSGQAYHGGMMGFPDDVDAVLLTNSDDVTNPENVLIAAYHDAYA